MTEAALALAGCELHPFTRELTAKMGRGEITGDQAVATILTRLLGRLPSPSAATLPTHDGSTLDPAKTAELSCAKPSQRHPPVRRRHIIRYRKRNPISDDW